MRPTGLFLYLAAVLVCVTLVVAAWKVRKHQEGRAYTAIVRKAEASGDPRTAVELLQAYVETHPDNQITREAKHRLAEARRLVAREDHERVMRAVDDLGQNYEQAAALLHDYVETDPEPAYRQLAKERLTDIPRMIDDRDFHKIDERYPETAGSLADRESALKEYLSKHPNGRHADAARNALARIPDARDERTLRRVITQIEQLRASGKLEAAVAEIDSELGQIAATKRKAALPEIRTDLVARIDKQHADRILRMPRSSPAETTSLISECRLFLLSRPSSTHAQTIRALHDGLIQQQQERAWQSLQERLAELTDDPIASIQLLREYARRWPNRDARLRARQRSLPYHVALFKAGIAKLGRSRQGFLTVANRPTISGRVVRQAEEYVVFDSETGVLKMRIPLSEVNNARLPEGGGGIDQFDGQALSIDSTAPDPAEVQQLHTLATEHGLRDRMLLCNELLAAIDPEDNAAKQILVAAGYSFSCGRWRSRESRVRMMCDAHQERIAAEADSVAASLALKVNVSDGGTEKEVPLTCSIASKQGKLTVVSLASTDEPLSAGVKISFVPLLRPLIAEHRRLGAPLSRILREIRKNALFEAQVEITEAREELGLGLVPRLEAQKWIVDTVLPSGAADRAWVEADDQLLAVDGLALSDSMSSDEVQERLSAGSVSTAVELKLSRRGQVFVVEVTPDDQMQVTLEGRFRIAHNLTSNYELRTYEWHELSRIQEAP